MRNNISSFFNGLYLDAYLIDIWEDGQLLASFIMNPISDINIEGEIVRLYDDSENMITINCEGGELIREEDRIIFKNANKEFSFISIQLATKALDKINTMIYDNHAK